MGFTETAALFEVEEACLMLVRFTDDGPTHESYALDQIEDALARFDTSSRRG